MPSIAFLAVTAGLQEIDALQRANPSPTGAAPEDPATTRAIGRASIVLLSSHFERYHYGVTEEVVAAINVSALPSERLPEEIRLRHSEAAIDELAAMEWIRRGPALRELVAKDGPLWSSGTAVSTLDYARLLRWMSAPKPRELLRLYRMFGIHDVFSSVTRTAHTRSALWLSIESLVDKRNNIAHGDATESATQADVRRYVSAVGVFCQRVDRLVGRHLGRALEIPLW